MVVGSQTNVSSNIFAAKIKNYSLSFSKVLLFINNQWWLIFQYFLSIYLLTITTTLNKLMLFWV